jgi:hypothetical protein
MNKRIDRPVKPVNVLIVAVSVNVFLGAFILLFPSGEMKTNNKLALKFVSMEELSHPKKKVTKDILPIIKSVKTIDTSVAYVAPKPRQIVIDYKYEPNDTLRIQYQDARFKALEDFFTALLKTENTGELLRIAHYGDSQIEGDRMSDYLRNRFQLTFGGCGPGIVVPIDISNSRISIIQNQSRHWVKYAVYGKSKTIQGSDYGIGASNYRYSNVLYKMEYRKDSTGTDSVKKQHFTTYIDDSPPSLNFKKSSLSFQTLRRFTKVSLLYGQHKERTVVKHKFDQQSAYDTLEGTNKFNMRSWHVDRNLGMADFSFVSKTGPDIFGVAFDCDSGVAVDNFAMRGSSGTEFVKMNPELLNSQFNALNTRLLILQYGVNVVPYADSDADCDYYFNIFYKQLKMLKSLNPDRSILVIGVSDMSTRKGGQYVSFPYVSKIRDAQKKAAFMAGCAFWDLYEAMGGENAMPSWVMANPSLANKDFIHFNMKGSNIIAEMIFNSLMTDYQDFKKSKINP